MADIKITLEAVSKEFADAIKSAGAGVQALINNINQLNQTLNQTTAAHKQATQASQAFANAQKNQVNQSNQAIKTNNLTANSIAALTTIYGQLANAIVSAFSQVPELVKAGIDNIDDFRKATIGTAAAMTNLADLSAEAGLTWQNVFTRNLKATEQTFIELEKLSARYFASAQDLQLAYNAFAQRGIVLRKTELEQLAQLTDLILLLTQGQQSTIQVQEEIRSLINGNIRPTSQLAQLVKSFGKDVKEVAAEIRATQSLIPLEDILRGAQQATSEIQKTFIAAKNGLETALRQIGRIAGDALYTQIVGAVNRITTFLNDNKSGIAAAVATVGNSFGNLIKEIQGFIGVVSKANELTTFFGRAYIFLVAGIETLIHGIAQTAKVLVNILNELISVASSSFETVKNFVTSPVQSIKDLLKQENPFKNFISGAVEFGKKMDEAMKPLTDEKAVDFFDKRVNELTKAGKTAAGSVAKKLSEGGVEPAIIKDRPLLTQDEVRQQEHLIAALNEARSRLGRAERTSDVAEIITETDLRLQELRRTLALTEQGFLATRDAIQGFRSPLQVIGDFISQNVKLLAFDQAKVSVQGLRQELTSISRDIQGDVFKNLAEQLKVVRKGFEDVTRAAENAAKKLIESDVTPLQAEAANVRAANAAEFKKLADTAQFLLDKQRQVTEETLRSKNATKAQKEAAVESLRVEQQRFRNAVESATELQVQKDKSAVLLDQIAAAKQQRIEEQLAEQIAGRSKQLKSEELRILQAQNQEVAKLLIQNAQLRNTSAERLADAQRQLPQTRLEGARQEIVELKIQFAKEESDIQGRLDAITTRLQEVGLSASAADIALKNSTEATLAKTQRDNEAVIAIRTLAVETETAANALANAGRRMSESLVTALTDSFEGKKTDFKQVFKGIADTLVKDSLKDVFDKVGTALKSGFQSAFDSLGKSLPQSLQGTLGPAFMAGIGLIASFVLGQLMGDNGGSSTASNPTVGIQSTEQVRGLIGGETQIPIGQIGESLQDALVPTNLLLARIARAVEGQLGGLSSAQIEDVIGRAVGDALQIQGA